MTWAREQPVEAGDYWLYVDRWEAEPRYARVFVDLDGDWACVFVGFSGSLKLKELEPEIYWQPIHKPTPPMMPARMNGEDHV